MNRKDRYRRAKEVFVQVYSLSEDERRASLREACAGDPDLQREVEALLGYHQGSGSLGPAGVFEAKDREGDPEPADGEPLPDRLGRFRIVRRLGRGAMGVVYLADDPATGCQVALKLLPEQAISAQAASRLRTEAQALRRLEHPGIARFHEAGALSAGGRDVPYLAMEPVRGRPWRDFEREDRASDLGRIELLAALCEAVGHAHDRGIVHRDLKPENILVEESGQPKVLDFGLARMIDLDARASAIRTMPGVVVGTLRYMSPEQARGDSEAIDARADVYALGVIGYELLAGRPPYDLPDDPAEAIARILKVVPPPAGRLRPSLRGAIEAILETALAKDPSHRYAAAGEMAADLRRSLVGERVDARRAAARLRAWRGRHRIRPASAMALAALILILGSVAGFLAARKQSAGPPASGASLERIYSSLEDADRLRHSADADGERLGRAEREYQRVRRELQRWPFDESTRGLSIYTNWRLGELGYFRGTSSWDPEPIQRALEHWSLANSTARPPVLPPGLDPSRPLHAHYLRLGQHHPIAGMGLAHAALVFYENPAWHARMSLWCRQVARDIQDSLGVRGYYDGPLAEQHAREDDLLGRYELASALAQLGAIVDTTAHLDSALASYARLGRLPALAENPSACASVLQSWGAAWLERAERRGTRADLDSAEACLRRAIEMRDRRSTRAMYGGAERWLARALCQRAEREPDTAAARAGFAEAIALLEQCHSSADGRADRTGRSLWSRALADALVGRAIWTNGLDGGPEDGTREDLGRADSLLRAAAPLFTPERLPAQAALVEFSRGRLAAGLWQRTGAARDREAARQHFARARELVPLPQHPALHRRIQAEEGRLAAPGDGTGS